MHLPYIMANGSPHPSYFPIFLHSRENVSFSALSFARISQPDHEQREIQRDIEKAIEKEIERKIEREIERDIEIDPKVKNRTASVLSNILYCIL